MRVSLVTLCMLGVVALGRHQKFDLKRQAMKVKKATTLRKKQLFMQDTIMDYGFDMPVAPTESCMNEESYEYRSGTDCDQMWADWDEWCWSQDDKTYIDFC